MAAKKKGTIERAQASLLKAMRDFEKVVSGMMNPAPKKTKAKKKAKRKTKARKR